MLKRLKRLLDGDGTAAETPDDPHEKHHMAAAVLLVEAARSDTDYDADEKAAIERALSAQFGLRGEEVQELIAAAEDRQEGSVEIYSFTRDLKEAFPYEERVQIIEMLWEVVYADGTLDRYEDRLVRRVAGLLHVEDRERGAARKRVLAKLGRSE